MEILLGLLDRRFQEPSRVPEYRYKVEIWQDIFGAAISALSSREGQCSLRCYPGRRAKP